jgi:methionyl-tRNA formyltransferase
MGREKSGYSWFYPTDGLDEGEVLLQWECPIEPDDTVINLYFKKIYPSAVDSVLEVCDLFRNGNPPRHEQDESLATYERRCTKKHAHIDWYKPIAQVYNLIRGCNPAPGAWTSHNGVELSVYDSAPVAGDGVAGRVYDISEAGMTVQSVGGRLLVKRVKPAGGAKITAAEWAAESGISIGDQLGS